MKDKKQRLIREILSNNTYLENSQLIINLGKSLEKLSYEELSNLDLIIKIIVRETEEKYK
jgi:hypothetical protein